MLSRRDMVGKEYFEPVVDDVENVVMGPRGMVI